MDRCREEIPDLQAQKDRLGRWARGTLQAVEERIAEVGDSLSERSGKGILLKRWKKLLMSILNEVQELQ